jgi:branched-chain amino acid transport system ATP-binding protein
VIAAYLGVEDDEVEEIEEKLDKGIIEEGTV